MTIGARVYCALVIGAGLLGVAAGMWSFSTSDPLRLLAWAATAVMLASVKLLPRLLRSSRRLLP